MRESKFNFPARIAAPSTISVFIILAIALYPCSEYVVGEVNYELTYNDAVGDVCWYDPETNDYGIVNATTASKHENIDIIRIQSYEETGIIGAGGLSAGKPRIILLLTVAGIIVDSMNISYTFMVTVDETTYEFNYMNHVCEEQTTGKFYVASGSGTDTLKITVPKDDFGEPQNIFDIYAISREDCYTSDNNNDNLIYMDEVPPKYIPIAGAKIERVIEILEPTDGATVFGYCKIYGVTIGEEGNIQSVEIQVDTQLETNWVLATTFNSWASWEYIWDTTLVSETSHTIYARAFNGTAYTTVSITLWVNQTCAVAPPLAEKPAIFIGDWFAYNGTMDMSYMGTHIRGSFELTCKVIDDRPKELGGLLYDVYTFKIHLEGSGMAMGTSISMVGDGELYIIKANLSIVYQTMHANIFITPGATIDLHITMQYDPPLNKYQFPIAICEKWYSTSNTTVETTTKVIAPMGEDTYNTTNTSNLTVHCEGLHIEDVVVPAGEFSTFVIRCDEQMVEDNDDSNNNSSVDYDEDSEEDAITGYELQYYAPALGFIVKLEAYDDYGNLMTVMYLNNYNKHGMDLDAPAQSNRDTLHIIGFELTFTQCLLGIAIVTIIILGLICVLKYRASRRIKFPELSATALSMDRKEPKEEVAKISVEEPTTIRCDKCNTTLMLPAEGLMKRPVIVQCSKCSYENLLR
jgi:hypothetical protein